VKEVRESKPQVFVCIDCETTGLDPVLDRIIEVAVVVFTVHEDLAQFESLVNPGVAIPETSILIHRITDSMVEGKPGIEDVLPEVLRLVGRHPIVGHGVEFDIALLANAAERAGIAHTLSNNRVIDTLRMARLYGESPTNSLEQLRRHFNIERSEAHRAMADVAANVSVFKYLFRQYKNLNALYAALDKPVLMKIMPLGKYKGRLIKDIPLEYLQWAAHKDFDQDLLFSLRSEIKRRKKGNLFSQVSNPFSAL
jgi:DNA polymerase-3 subunit epsilon